MSGFNLIPPHEATALVEQAGRTDALAFLADHALTGKVKVHAEFMEKLQPGGSREVVRDQRIAAEMWRRIISEDKVGEVVTGRVRLDGSAEFGGGPKITIIGIRFDDVSVQAAIARHSGRPRPMDVAPEPPTTTQRQDAPSQKEEAAPAPKPKARRAANPSAIPPGAITVTVNQTMDITGLGRTKVNELMDRGVLERVKVDGRTLITVASIRRLLGQA